jgi:RHS repeat-associated protein
MHVAKGHGHADVESAFPLLYQTEGYRFVYQDHIGSTRQLSRSDMQRDYYPFGQTLNAAGDDLTSMQFSQKQVAPDSTIYYFGVRYYSPRIGRWLVPDPAGQYWSPYTFCGNNPLVFVDEDGELAWFVPILIGATIGGASGAWTESQNGGLWYQGFFKGAGIGAVGGAMSMIGNPGAWYGLQNILVGAGEGMVTGALDAWAFNGNFGQSIKMGAILGGGFGLITTEQFKNTLKGNIWQSDQQVLDQFLAQGTNGYNKAIEYFGGKGMYNPEHEFFMKAPNASAATTDLPNIQTIYNTPAFADASKLKEVIFHENFHRHQYIFEGFTSVGVDPNPHSFSNYLFRESLETPAWKATYRNQGLFQSVVSSAKVRRWTGLKEARWWHEIYKIPRRFGKF